jgi:ABC-2 type transport system permease protein
MLTEERKIKADKFSSTESASSMQIVLGKFFGALTLVAIALLFTLPYVFTLAYLGNLDQGKVMGGYLALLLMAGAYISIGLLASGITSNQVLSFLLAITMSLFFHIIFEVLAAKITGLPPDLVTYLTMSAHFESMVRGILDTRDVLYFLTIIGIGLILTELSLTKRNILN